MLALVLTVLAAAFFLGPELLSRWVLSFVVPRRSISSNKGEEVTRAVMWAVIPLVLALVWVHWHHTATRWGGWRDVRLVASALYSSASFDRNEHEFYNSLTRVGGMVWSLLWRLYLLVFAASSCLYLIIRRYRWIRSRLKPRWAKSLLATVVLPRISEWHVLLSDMLLPGEDVFLLVDVLTKGGLLYEGKVQDRMLAPDGSLQTLTLSEPRRFLREEYKAAREKDASVDRKDFWRSIPSQLFILIGSDVISVNVRYPPRTPVAADLTKVGVSREKLEALKTLLDQLTPPSNPPVP